MVARGRVRNGVVVLDNGVRVPEGQAVPVLAPDPVPASPRRAGSRLHSVLDIATVRVGAVLRPMAAADALLGAMLEGRV